MIAGFRVWRRERDSNPRAFRPAIFKIAAIDLSAIPPSVAGQHYITLSRQARTQRASEQDREAGLREVVVRHQHLGDAKLAHEYHARGVHV